MTTLIKMPANFDMVISHSPPVFSHSPPTGYLSEYNSTSGYNRCNDPMRGFCRPQIITNSTQNIRNLHQLKLNTNMPIVPKRSCLVHRHSDSALKSSVSTAPLTPTTDEVDATVDIKSSLTKTNNNDNNETNTKMKKKVVFADDQGLALVEVRIMSEPSNVPPLWSLQFIAHITQGMVSPTPTEQWTVDFKQPASDYLEFRSRLEKDKVSLENVIVRENESVVVGTVKVKNMSFHKEVIVRATWDGWKNQEDIFCTYSKFPNLSSSLGAHVIYDTFSFKITLPPNSLKLEFCVCFRVDGTEYWDNNEGRNYTLSKRVSPRYENNYSLLKFNKYNNNNNCTLNNNNNNNNGSSSPITIPKSNDVTQSKISSWSDFATMVPQETNCPYW